MCTDGCKSNRFARHSPTEFKNAHGPHTLDKVIHCSYGVTLATYFVLFAFNDVSANRTHFLSFTRSVMHLFFVKRSPFSRTLTPPFFSFILPISTRAHSYFYDTLFFNTKLLYLYSPSILYAWSIKDTFLFLCEITQNSSLRCCLNSGPFYGIAHTPLVASDTLRRCTYQLNSS